jgi:hypothetical protein
MGFNRKEAKLFIKDRKEIRYKNIFFLGLLCQTLAYFAVKLHQDLK